MSQLLINHSLDLKRLRDEGYELELNKGYLSLHHIPYVNSRMEIKYGTLISELTLANNTTTSRPGTHVVYWTGELPCYQDGSFISAIHHASQRMDLGNGILVHHSFSNKPPAGYTDYYSKMTRYADIISAPAKSLDKSVTEKTFKTILDDDSDNTFHYLDTNSSRSNVNQFNSKFKGQKVAIVGLGGTGAYILDLVAKTPVHEIHLYDNDDFLQHNAFRSPGAASAIQLNEKTKKVDYYNGIYSNMHKGVKPHASFIQSHNLSNLDNMSFVFLCVDQNSVRKLIIDYLLLMKISFIDVGLGVLPVDDALIGTIRFTAGTPQKNDHLIKRISSGDDNIDNAYSTNIQIADLNALNAALAVIKWKKITGFYQDLEKEHHCTYCINVSQLVNEDLTT